MLNNSTNVITTKDLNQAKHLWNLVTDVSLFKRSKRKVISNSLHKIIANAANNNFDKNHKPKPEVLLVAKFIANLEPSYKNSNGQYVDITFLRTQVGLSEDDLDFVCNKIEDVVKSYINVSKETTIVGQKLKIKTSMPKKRLIHSAIKHLINGSEIFNDQNDYHELKARSLLIDNVKVNYAWLVGTAIALEYKSVPEMMEDMCLKFIDQTENVESKGIAVFYDGAVRTELLY